MNCPAMPLPWVACSPLSLPLSLAPHSLPLLPCLRLSSSLPSALVAPVPLRPGMLLSAGVPPGCEHAGPRGEAHSCSRWRSSVMIGGRNSERSSVRRSKRRDRDSSAESTTLEDQDLRTGLNEVCTEAVKVMLGDRSDVTSAFKEKLQYMVKFLIQEEQEEAARFLSVLMCMLEHEVPSSLATLSKPYQAAFQSMMVVLEDSGWMLVPEGQEGTQAGVSTVDDELIPPVLRTQY